jgi:hypothetical protein
MQSLPTHLKAKSLVSVRRRNVDDYGIQGFLVGLSDTLMALEYVYDFQIDGLAVLRRSDITEVKRTGTDEFQERLLKREGIQPGAQAPVPLQLEGWQSLIQQLSDHYPLMILERELGPLRGSRLAALSEQQQLRLSFTPSPVPEGGQRELSG